MICRWVFIPHIPHYYFTFSSFLGIYITFDAFGNPRLTHLVSVLFPALFLLSVDIPCLILAQYHGRLNYAFWMHRKPQKRFAHLT